MKTLWLACFDKVVVLAVVVINYPPELGMIREGFGKMSQPNVWLIREGFCRTGQPVNT